MGNYEIKRNIDKIIDKWADDLLNSRLQGNNGSSLKPRGLWDKIKSGFYGLIRGDTKENPYYYKNRFGDYLGSKEESTQRMSLAEYAFLKKSVEDAENILLDEDSDLDKLKLFRIVRQAAEDLKSQIHKVIDGLFSSTTSQQPATSQTDSSAPSQTDSSAPSQTDSKPTPSVDLLVKKNIKDAIKAKKNGNDLSPKKDWMNNSKGLFKTKMPWVVAYMSTLSGKNVDKDDDVISAIKEALPELRGNFGLKPGASGGLKKIIDSLIGEDSEKEFQELMKQKDGHQFVEPKEKKKTAPIQNLKRFQKMDLPEIKGEALDSLRTAVKEGRGLEELNLRGEIIAKLNSSQIRNIGDLMNKNKEDLGSIVGEEGLKDIFEALSKFKTKGKSDKKEEAAYDEKLEMRNAALSIFVDQSKIKDKWQFENIRALILDRESVIQNMNRLLEKLGDKISEDKRSYLQDRITEIKQKDLQSIIAYLKTDDAGNSQFFKSFGIPNKDISKETKSLFGVDLPMNTSIILGKKIDELFGED